MSSKQSQLHKAKKFASFWGRCSFTWLVMVFGQLMVVVLWVLVSQTIVLRT
jgi:hypothetical protein